MSLSWVFRVLLHKHVCIVIPSICFQTLIHSQMHVLSHLAPWAGLAWCAMSLITSIRIWALRTAMLGMSAHLAGVKHTWTHTSNTNTHTLEDHSHTSMHCCTAKVACTLPLLCVCGRITLHMRHSCTVVLFSSGGNRISSPFVLSCPVAGHTLPHTQYCTCTN